MRSLLLILSLLPIAASHAFADVSGDFANAQRKENERQSQLESAEKERILSRGLLLLETRLKTKIERREDKMVEADSSTLARTIYVETASHLLCLVSVNANVKGNELLGQATVSYNCLLPDGEAAAEGELEFR